MALLNHPVFLLGLGYPKTEWWVAACGCPIQKVLFYYSILQMGMKSSDVFICGCLQYDAVPSYCYRGAQCKLTVSSICLRGVF